ncbi:MAG: carbonic anhydrase [Flavobacteriales bacterium]|nr:carbonic anhydrase [Flavobacteriales bacterium]
MKSYIFQLSVLVSLIGLALLGCKKESSNLNLSSFPPTFEDAIIKTNPIQTLIEGNLRFISGNPIHPDTSLERIKELKKGQNPYAVVVSCSDSRVPPELVFDQGLGDIFTIRTAGNIIGDYELGSIEYAVEHAGAKLVVVLGHENCGALTAFINHKPDETHGHEHDHIDDILSYLKEEKELQNIPDSLKANINLAVKKNVEHGVTLLKNAAPIMSSAVKKGDLTIVGAIYDLDTGKVTFLN